eukprot:6112299-Alexandrium_andersonii.AAC.1
MFVRRRNRDPSRAGRRGISRRPSREGRPDPKKLRSSGPSFGLDTCLREGPLAYAGFCNQVSNCKMPGV